MPSIGAPRRRAGSRRSLAAVVALVVVALPVAGCLDGGFGGGPTFVTNSKVTVEQDFEVADVVNPDTPGTLRVERQFSVVEGEQDMVVSMEVTFDPESPVEEVPSGNFGVRLVSSAGEEVRWNTSQSGSNQETIGRPAVGLWDVIIEAQGQGHFRVHVETQAPE